MAQGDEPSARFGRLRVDPVAHGLHEEQLEKTSDYGFRAKLRVAHFMNEKPLQQVLVVHRLRAEARNVEQRRKRLEQRMAGSAIEVETPAHDARERALVPQPHHAVALSLERLRERNRLASNAQGQERARMAPGASELKAGVRSGRPPTSSPPTRPSA
jgi:hypothetical protein